MKWFFSIRAKLFALVLMACLVLISVTYWQVGSKSEAVANRAIDRSLTQSGKILNTRITSRFTFIQELSSGIARDGRVLPLVAEEQSLTLQDLSKEYEEVYDFNTLFFLNARGVILARSDQPDAIGINLAGRTSLFDDALNGKQSSGFISSQGKLMQAVVTPVFDNVATDIVRGAVVLAYELSPEMADEIVALTESQIGFFVFSREAQGVITGVEKSYMTNDQLAEKLSRYLLSDDNWEAILDAESDGFRRRFSIDGQVQHSVFRRINGKDGNRLGFVVAMRAEAELKQPFKDIQQTLLVVGALCLFFASVFAALMAIGVSRPILRLVETTKQIQNGVYPASKQAKPAKDEVGLLQNALVRMGYDLREKAELESYLADLADEVGVDGVDIDISEKHEIKNTDNRSNVLTPEEDSVDATVLRPDQAARSVEQGPFSVGQMVDGRYRILALLGSGAMSNVYLANDVDLDENIALKVIDEAFLATVEGINIKEEIRLARKTTHRNIVRTFDFGLWKKSFYITMEYVAGYDLGLLVREKGALDISIGIAMSKQICSAMISAHQLGIIHRDLKPSNMMINRQGILKIMDFGLAMKVDKDQHGSSADGPLMGTPRYMAPEQFSVGAQLDERADIYAIGVIMFTIFNGEPPYSAPDFARLADKHLHDPIPEIGGKNAVLPTGLREIIHGALAKDPDDRFQSVKELLDRLNHL